MARKMTPEEVTAFIDSRPGWIALTTISKNGMPHTIPIGYFRDGENIYMGCRAGTQKLKNIERNPNVSVMLESGSTMADIKGICIQGVGSVVTDPAELLRLAREGGRRRGIAEDKLPTEPNPTAAYIKVEPRKTISWHPE